MQTGLNFFSIPGIKAINYFQTVVSRESQGPNGKGNTIVLIQRLPVLFSHLFCIPFQRQHDRATLDIGQRTPVPHVCDQALHKSHPNFIITIKMIGRLLWLKTTVTDFSQKETLLAAKRLSRLMIDHLLGGRVLKSRELITKSRELKKRCLR